MKRFLAFLLLINLLVSAAFADEGMWTFDNPPLKQWKEKYGFETSAIVNMSDVIAYLYNKPYHDKIYIDDGMKVRMDDYYRQYGAR